MTAADAAFASIVGEAALMRSCLEGKNGFADREPKLIAEIL